MTTIPATGFSTRSRILRRSNPTSTPHVAIGSKQRPVTIPPNATSRNILTGRSSWAGTIAHLPHHRRPRRPPKLKGHGEQTAGKESEQYTRHSRDEAERRPGTLARPAATATSDGVILFFSRYMIKIAVSDVSTRRWQQLEQRVVHRTHNDPESKLYPNSN